MTSPSFRDVELLSAYLDGQLSTSESARLESRLQSDPTLRSVMEDLSQSRTLLRKLPQRRAPRNFTLTPEKAGVRPPLPRVFPVFRYASIFAGLLLAFSLAANTLVPLAAPPPAYGMGGGGPMVAMAPGGSGGGDGNIDAQAAAPAEAVPTQQLRMEVVTTPNAKAAPTEAPLQSFAAPEAGTESTTQEAQPLPTPLPAPVRQLIPQWLVASFFALALLAGAGAFLTRWWADRQFARRSKR